MMKCCTKCGCLKEIDQFNKDKKSKDKHRCQCRTCDNISSTERGREVRGSIPMSENKECSSYLGVAVAERLVRHLFKDVVRMPNNNTGFDFVCAKDKKIDVKSSCLKIQHNKYLCWSFHIVNNQIADYFLLLAFDNRKDLIPLHQWLIPSHVLNHLKHTSISPSTLSKWEEYSQPIDQAQICCDTIKRCDTR